MSEYTELFREEVSYGIVQKQYFNLDGTIDLESGHSFGPVTIAYETYGRLNDKKDNAILILHALTGDSHVAGYYDEKDATPGWWEFLVGPGKALDTSRYFVICSNILGGCNGSTGPSSINPSNGMPYGRSFPFITIGDMVVAQKKLIEHLNIECLKAVIGGSIGGMQAMKWCTMYPSMVESAILLATTPRNSPMAIAFNEVARQAIMADPNWNKGNYYHRKTPATGLAVARMIGHITYLSERSMAVKFGRRLQNGQDYSFTFDGDFQVESYLHYQGNKFVKRFDANSILHITKAADYFDLGIEEGKGSLPQAFSKATSRFLVLSFSSDWLYPTTESKKMVKAMKKAGRNVSFCEIESKWGHDAFLIPSVRLSELVKGFINHD